MKPEATKVFSRLARAYARGRPDYPPAVFDRIARDLGLRRRDWVIDLGAGTGISTRPLVERGYRVVAVEPNREMLAASKARHPRWRFARARAERLPFRPMFKAVICAQTFHWFDARVVLRELGRLTRGVAVLWNTRDTRLPFFRDFERLVVRYNPKHRPDYRTGTKWLTPGGHFRRVRQAVFPHRAAFTQKKFVAFVRSVSYIRNFVRGRRLAAFMREVRALMKKHFGASTMDLPYTTALWTAVNGTSFRNWIRARGRPSVRPRPSGARTRRRA